MQTKTLRRYHGQLIKWNGHRWENYSDERLRKELYEYLEGKQFIKVNTQGVKNMTPYKPTKAKVNDIFDAMNGKMLIEKDPPCWLVDDENLPNPENLLVFKNCMLDIVESIKIGKPKVYDNTPSLFTLNAFPYDFDPNARSQLFEDILKSMFTDENIKDETERISGATERIRLYFQWLGYNLLPDMSQEKLMLFIGGTRSGKSTLISVLHNILGERQCISTSYTALAGRFGCSPLENKLAATVGDVKMPRRDVANIALETLLKIVGGDSVPIEPKFRQQYSAYLKCRFTIAMNDIPTFSDSAQAFVARSLILDFPNCYKGRENTKLKMLLENEASEGKLINYAISGLTDLKEQGSFTVLESALEFINDLKEMTSPISTFIEECCLLEDHAEAYSVKEQLFEAWTYWCKQNNHYVGNSVHFYRNLRQICSSVENFRPREASGKQIQALRGIVLQDWVYTEYLQRPKS